MGLTYQRLHQYHRALSSFDRALSLWRELGRQGEEAKTQVNRGKLYATLGDRNQAVADLEQALKIRRVRGHSQPIADALNSLGFVHTKWRKKEAARRSFEAALEVWPDRDDMTTANSLLGLVLTRPGLGIEAQGFVERSLEIYRAESEAGEAVTRLVLARIHREQDRRVEALESLAEALELFESIRDAPGIAQTRLELAAMERLRGRLDAARSELEQALAIVEDLRASAVTGGELRAGFFATKQVYYERYVDLLMELHSKYPEDGYEAQALTASDRSRARSLLEALVDRERSLDPRLLELERQIEDNQRRMEHLLRSANPDPVEVERLEQEQQDLQRSLEKLRGQIDLSNPGSVTLGPGQLPKAEKIQGQLVDSESLLLTYQLGADRSFLWAVTPEAISAFVLPPRDEIEGLAWTAYERMKTKARVAKVRTRMDLAALSRVLLEPVADQLARTRRLVIVTGGALLYLPFEALPLPGAVPAGPESAPQWLGTAIEVVYLPSASTLAVLRAELAGREPAPGLLGLVADPVVCRQDERFPSPPSNSAEPCKYRRLANASEEVAAILERVPPDNRFVALGFAASRDAVTRGSLASQRILHFATHGELSSKYAGISRLVLSLFDSGGQRREDGFWHAYEIYREHLPAELVVLSACETALGEQIPGEGLMGLTRAFMNAGAPRVMVSLWRVDDQATAALMGSFYEHLLARRLPPPAALRAAKNFVRSHGKWESPYYWAGFVLQGEWRDFPTSI